MEELERVLTLPDLILHHLENLKLEDPAEIAATSDDGY